MPEHRAAAISWTGHAPFAFWIVDALRPDRLVELGTHAGYSYLCFCQAVATFGTQTECHAVDTWTGDEHAGRYGEEVFETVRARAAPYADFSTLHRTTFAEAAGRFEDSSIDLLHIDGRHLYDDVREDYETWLPKLTPGGIVLLHDTRVQRDNFGVHSYFAELRERHPSFEFGHQHGLGVVAPKGVPDTLRALLEADAETARFVAHSYERLGDYLALRFERDATQADRYEARLAGLDRRLDRVEQRLDAVPNGSGRAARARKRIRGSLRLMREMGPIAGAREASRRWSRLGREPDQR